VTSATYDLFLRAVRERKQVVCVYQGKPRILCPVILGHSKGAEKVLAFQIGGAASKPLPLGGAWKCMRVAEARGATLQDGKWAEGIEHGTAQTCVETVDYDVNPASPYSPRFRL
jgi:hypothetical protein